MGVWSDRFARTGWVLWRDILSVVTKRSWFGARRGAMGGALSSVHRQAMKRSFIKMISFKWFKRITELVFKRNHALCNAYGWRFVSVTAVS